MVTIENYDANGKALKTDKKVMGTIWRWNRRVGDKPIQVSQPKAAELMHIGERTFRESVERLKNAGWLWAWRYTDDLYTYYVPHCGLLHLIRAARLNQTSFKNIIVTHLGSPVCIFDSPVCFCLSKLANFKIHRSPKKIRHPPYI